MPEERAQHFAGMPVVHASLMAHICQCMAEAEEQCRGTVIENAGRLRHQRAEIEMTLACRAVTC